MWEVDSPAPTSIGSETAARLKAWPGGVRKGEGAGVSKAETYAVDNELTRQEVLALIDSGNPLEVSIRPLRKQRTIKQNAALHVFCELLAQELNAAGYDMKRTLKEGVEIPWNADRAKEFLWRPVQAAVLGIESTTEADTSQYTEVYQPLMRHMNQKFGVNVEWPSLR